MTQRAAKILVVDDSPLILDLVADALEDRGYEVVTTDQPLDCERLLAELCPEILILDIEMPVLDGPSLLQLVRHRNMVENCHVLLYSDRDHAELTATIRACGADGGAQKSPGCEELIAVIESKLGRSPKTG